MNFWWNTKEKVFKDGNGNKVINGTIVSPVDISGIQRQRFLVNRTAKECVLHEQRAPFVGKRIKALLIKYGRWNSGDDILSTTLMYDGYRDTIVSTNYAEYNIVIFDDYEAAWKEGEEILLGIEPIYPNLPCFHCNCEEWVPEERCGRYIAACKNCKKYLGESMCRPGECRGDKYCTVCGI